MKINANNFNVGKVPRKENDLPVKKSGEVSKAAENTDKIELSFQGALQKEVESLQKKVVEKIEEPTSPERLDVLKKAVEEKSYYVPTSDLVDAILQRWIGL